MAAYLMLECRETGRCFSGGGLLEIDEMLCAAAGVPVTDDWFYNWMNTIGFTLALSEDFANAHEFFDAHFADPANAGDFNVLAFLEARFYNASYRGR